MWIELIFGILLKEVKDKGPGRNLGFSDTLTSLAPRSLVLSHVLAVMEQEYQEFTQSLSWLRWVNLLLNNGKYDGTLCFGY